LKNSPPENGNPYLQL